MSFEMILMNLPCHAKGITSLQSTVSLICHPTLHGHTDACTPLPTPHFPLTAHTTLTSHCLYHTYLSPMPHLPLTARTAFTSHRPYHTDLLPLCSPVVQSWATRQNAQLSYVLCQCMSRRGEEARVHRGWTAHQPKCALPRWGTQQLTYPCFLDCPCALTAPCFLDCPCALTASLIATVLPPASLIATVLPPASLTAPVHSS